MMAASISLKNMFYVLVDPKNLGIDTLFVLLDQMVEDLSSITHLNRSLTFDLEYMTNAAAREPDKFFHEYSHLDLPESAARPFIRIFSRFQWAYVTNSLY